MGLKWSDIADQFEVGVWPENADAVSVFASMTTQWRVGPGGVIGLDYGALPEVMRMRGISRSRWPEVFDDIRIMEDTALGWMRK